MSHESHNNSQENPFTVPFRSAFWLVIILVGLYIASLNFIAAEKGGEGEKKEATEMPAASGAEGQKAESAAPKKEEGAKAEEKKETKESEAKEEAGH